MEEVGCSVESTLDSTQQLSKQATGEQELQNYVSFRMTTPKKWDELVEVVDGFDWYISYHHIGKNGDNPHFHVAVPGAKAELERIRKRVKTAGLFGNKCFSGKPMQNSILQFIQYASREETEPNIRGEVQQWIDAAPRWIQANLLDNLNPLRGNAKPRKGAILLTSTKVLYQVWRWRQDRKRFDLREIDKCLMYMLEEMDDEGEPKYMIAPEWARRGIPTFWEDIFKDSCDKGRITFKTTKFIWKDVLFRDSRF